MIPAWPSFVLTLAAACFGADGKVTVSLRNAAGVVPRVVSGPTKVTTNGRQLLVNDEPFYIKGVCWNPVGIGGNHPEDLNWKGFVDQDAKLMREAGINAVRTYEGLIDLDVLDILYENGIYVLNNIYGYYATPLADIGRVINATKDHPAILMWSVGNEWNYNKLYSEGSGSVLTYNETRDRLIEAIDIAKELDPNHLVTTIYGEVPFTDKQGTDSYEVMDRVDVWALNVYRGAEWFDAEGKTIFESWEEFTPSNPKPMFIGEYGADAWDSRSSQNNYSAQAWATQNLAQGILANLTLNGGVASGGFIFEWADEWWKDSKGENDEHDIGGSAPGGGPWPDMTFNEEWFGLLPIERTSRPAYDAYKSVIYPGGTAPDPSPPSPPPDSQGVMAGLSISWVLSLMSLCKL